MTPREIAMMALLVEREKAVCHPDQLRFLAVAYLDLSNDFAEVYSEKHQADLDRDAALARAEAAERKRDEALAVLRKLQWSQVGNRCPSCRASLVADGGFNGQHETDCPLAAVLGRHAAKGTER